MTRESHAPPLPRDWATVPNAVTVLRLLLVIPITALVVQGVAPILTVVLLAMFGASDWVDGHLARRLGQSSRTGAILDPVADRAGIVAIAIAFVAAGHLPPWIAVVVAAVDAVLGAAYLIVRPDRPPVVSGVGKVRTAVLMAGMALVGVGLLPTLDDIGLVGRVLCGGGAVLHLLAGVGYVRALARRDGSSTEL